MGFEGADAESLLVSGTQDEDFSEEFGSNIPGVSCLIDLPFPSINTLPQIAEQIQSVPVYARDRLSEFLQKDSLAYLQSLFELRRQCEDLEAIQPLRQIFCIMKDILFLNEPSLFEVLLSDQYFEEVVGCLEFDPDYPGDDFHRHRRWIQSSTLKQVVRMHDPSIVTKIKQTYRLGYIKDVILLRYLDDTVLSSFNAVNYFNNVYIVTKLTEDMEFIHTLFQDLMIAIHVFQTSDKQRENVCNPRDLFSLLTELCSISRGIKLQVDIFTVMAEHGLFTVLEEAMNTWDPETDSWLWSSVASILNGIVVRNPESLQLYIASHVSSPRFLGGMVNCLTNRSFKVDGGILSQLTEIFRHLINSTNSSIREPLVEHVFAVFLPSFVSAATLVRGENDPCFWSQFYSIETLVNLVNDHPLHILTAIRDHSLLPRMADLLVRPVCVHVKLAVIRFLKACLSIQNHTLATVFIQDRLLVPIFKAFFQNGARYNMLNSALLGFFDVIRKENVVPLIEDIGRHFKSQVEQVCYVNVFRAILDKYDATLEAPGVSSAETSVQPQNHAQNIKLLSEMEEERYFSSDDSGVETDLKADIDSPVAADSQEEFLDRSQFEAMHGKNQDSLSDEEEGPFLSRNRRTRPRPDTPRTLKRPRSLWSSNSNTVVETQR